MNFSIFLYRIYSIISSLSIMGVYFRKDSKFIMISQLHHIGINVSDAKRSMEFYQTHLGAKFVRGMYNPVIGKLIVYMQIDHMLLELMAPQTPHPDDTFGIIHIAFQIKDHSAEAARVEQLGYSFITKPRTAGSGSGRVCFFAVPGQISAEFMEREERLTVAWEPTCGILTTPYITLCSDCYDETRAFLTKAATMMELPVTRDSGYFILGTSALLLKRAKQGDPVYKSIALSCIDREQKIAELEAAGIPVTKVPAELADEYYFSDPDGILYQLL